VYEFYKLPEIILRAITYTEFQIEKFRRADQSATWLTGLKAELFVGELSGYRSARRECFLLFLEERVHAGYSLRPEPHSKQNE